MPTQIVIIHQLSNIGRLSRVAISWRWPLNSQQKRLNDNEEEDDDDDDDTFRRCRMFNRSRDQLKKWLCQER